MKESIGAFYLSRLSFLTHIFFLDLMHPTRVHALLWDGSKSSYCIIKKASVAIFYTYDKIFEMKNKNMISISDQIN